MDSVICDRKIIAVTAFGPFSSIETNSSSVIVEQLKSQWDANPKLSTCPVTLFTRTQIPVTYKAVQKVVDEIWCRNPALVIHVGVHRGADAISLEQQAFNSPYDMADECNDFCDCDGQCVTGGFNSLQCSLDLTRTCDKLNRLGFMTRVSTDPGRYLCGYIYYRSLHKSCDRTVFVHVPSIGPQFTESQLTEAFYQILLDLADQKGLDIPSVKLLS